jgi:hypothetical protein
VNNSNIFNNGGNVGIGTTAPAAKLDVAGTVALNSNALRIRTGGDANHQLLYNGSIDGPELKGNLTVLITTSVGGDAAAFYNGRVGIGTRTPSNGKLHVQGFNPVGLGQFAFYAFSGNVNTGVANGGGGVDASIWCSNRVVATEFNAYSDARLKHVIGLTDNQKDLQALMGIEVTDYTMIDKAQDLHPYKKVIAQQVETVYPQAISQTTAVIPNIYKVASIKSGHVIVPNDLQPGEKVRLIFEDHEELASVVTADAAGFTVDLPDDGAVFVFGREVHDLRAVDYEAISMLNVSATQAIVKQLNAQQGVIEQQQAQIDELQSLKAQVDELRNIMGLKAQR